MSDLNQYKKSGNHGIEFNADASNANLIDRFNRYYLPTPGSEFKQCRGYIFIVKPNMNIASGGGLSEYMQKNSYMEECYNNPLLRKIMLQLSSSSGAGFIPLFTNRFQGFDPQDISYKVNSSPETFRGWKVVFGRHAVESKVAPTISIPFAETKDLLVYHACKIWATYMEMMDNGQVRRVASSMRSNTLDYATTIYFILVGPDGHEIVFYSETIGAFVTSENGSSFSVDETKIATGTGRTTVSFAASFYEAMNPQTLERFKKACGNGGSSVKDTTYLEETVGWTGQPKIESSGSKHKLYFTQGG